MILRYPPQSFNHFKASEMENHCIKNIAFKMLIYQGHNMKRRME